MLVPYHTQDVEPDSERPTSTRVVVQSRKEQKWRSLENTSLSYNELSDLLGRISKEKTDNITLILDSCYGDAMGLNEEPQYGHPPRHDQNLSPSASAQDINNVPPGLTSRGMAPAPTRQRQDIMLGHSSHILLTGTNRSKQAFESSEGGIFTEALLAALEDSEGLKTMTYKKLVGKINSSSKMQR
ncbi:hypothetical protein D9611_013273 [Ephemerocybe angulata]|uniref:Uncharacterized protein n=1 Tax=Ephemerocybe angulata TaxID=980116 RepID=A0A8H5FIX2_9AGAR|nr:hypothetical protein D9611_013273 [Tulosesus angulatus]